MEIWKDVIGYEGLYQVSNLGNIKSLDRKDSLGRNVKEKILKQRVSTTGYLICDLSKYGKLKTFKIHQLVAIAFLNHKPNGFNSVVNHIDRNKLNNKSDNLEIISQRENTSYIRTVYYSKFTGVSFHKHKNKWTSSIKVNGKSKHLGYFDCELKANEAYFKAKSEL